LISPNLIKKVSFTIGNPLNEHFEKRLFGLFQAFFLSFFKISIDKPEDGEPNNKNYIDNYDWIKGTKKVYVSIVHFIFDWTLLNHLTHPRIFN
jgi:hypothetical protein